MGTTWQLGVSCSAGPPTGCPPPHVAITSQRLQIQTREGKLLRVQKASENFFSKKAKMQKDFLKCQNINMQ